MIDTRWTLPLSFAAALLAGCASGLVPTPPPPRQPEMYGVPTVAGQTWIAGYWDWRFGQYTWVNGHWDTPRPGYRWVPHTWMRENGGWRLKEGHWQHQ